MLCVRYIYDELINSIISPKLEQIIRGKQNHIKAFDPKKKKFESFEIFSIFES